MIQASRSAAGGALPLDLALGCGVSDEDAGKDHDVSDLEACEGVPQHPAVLAMMRWGASQRDVIEVVWPDFGQWGVAAGVGVHLRSHGHKECVTGVACTRGSLNVHACMNALLNKNTFPICSL